MLPLLISALLSRRFLSKPLAGSYRFLRAYLWLVLLVELLALLWKYKLYNAGPVVYSQNNIWIYNLSLIPQYLLFSFFYYRVIDSLRYRKFILVASAGLALFGIFNIVFIQQLFVLNYYTAIIANVLFVLWSVQYFLELNQREPPGRLDTNPVVWISVGNLIFHSGSLPYLVALGFPQLYTSAHFLAFFYVYTALHSFMYITFIIAFLCNPPSLK